MLQKMSRTCKNIFYLGSQFKNALFTINSLSFVENSLSKLDKMFLKKILEKVLSSKYLEDNSRTDLF